MSAPPMAPVRHAGASAFSLAVLAGPMSFGIAGPALILGEVAGGLGVSTGEAAWLVTVFGWGIAVGTPLMSGLVGHRGMRGTVMISALLALTGAGLVLVAPSLPVLLLAAAAQALGAAGLTVIAMQLADSPRRMGVATASLAVVGSVSPLAGSLVSDLLSWRVVLALPVVAVLAVPAVLRQAVRSAPPPGRFDAIGVVVLTGLVTALVSVPHQPVAAGLCAVVAAVALGLHLRARPAGFVPAALVRAPRFLGAAGLAFALAVGNFGLIYALPVRLSELTTWSSAQIGVAMVWPLLFGGALSWSVVAASARMRPRPMITALAVTGAAAALAAAFTSWVPGLLIAQAAASIAAASGQGVLAVRATTAAPEEHRPAAIGLFTLCYLLGTAFGPAIVALTAG
ncbi:MFS transporter [Streptosporangium minutum]|uniref:MFS transporter n=1 Tax=Streptosporangium minutum TaxID=569862 RepID=A0A243REN1_9ACTN|nr:MFS transporter [Streptosporangium minutum]OUC93185.1 MFS transporter [Streptosporangium minutum]